jgi:predicted DNA-binding transcriptional regulator AlpA
MSHISITGQQSDDVAGLPQLAPFADLCAAGIAHNWTHLARLIKEENFPVGILLSRNVRAWDVAQVRQWLSERPTSSAPLKGAATWTAEQRKAAWAKRKAKRSSGKHRAKRRAA